MSKTPNSFGGNMLLIKSSWDGAPSFGMIPVSLDCPYSECLFSPGEKTLAVISKVPKQALRMVPRIDTNGDVERAKVKRASGKDYKEERKTIDTLQEYYIIDKADIESFVKMFAVNADEFQFMSFFPEETAKKKKEGTPEPAEKG